MSLAAAAALAGTTVDAARRLTTELLTASMLGEASPGRYTVHDLLHLYAAELLDAAGERPGAERRLVHHYAATTRAAYLAYGRAPVGELDPAAESLAVERFPDIASSWHWFDAERPALIAAVHLAVALGLDRCAAIIALDWRPMSQALVRHHELEPHVRVALQAAYRTGDLRLQGDLERDLAMIYEKTDGPGDLALSEEHSARALAVFTDLGDLVGQAQTLRNRCKVLGSRGHFEAAEETGRRALDLARRAGQAHITGLCLFQLASLLTMRQRWAPAADLLSEAWTVVQVDGPRYLEEDIRARLALCLLELDRPREALDLCDQLTPGTGQSPSLEPEAQLDLASTAAAAAFRTGDTARAKAACLEFARLRRRAGYPAVLTTDYRDRVTGQQDKVLAVAAALGLELNFPRLP